jgi:hypothetical protein
MDFRIFVYVLFSAVFLFLFIRNTFQLFSLDRSNKQYVKRLKQLEFSDKKDITVQDLIEGVSKPFVFYIFPRFSLIKKYISFKSESIDRKLKFIGWDAYFKNTSQFISVDITLKTLGILAFLIIRKESLVFAALWMLPLVFGLNLFMNNSATNKKAKLLADFPNMLRVIEAYVSANIPFPIAAAKATYYVCDEWKKVLTDFVVECEIKSLSDALDTLKKIDIFEVREFVAITKLVLEQGGDAKKSFKKQAETLREIQKLMIAIKIGKRNTMVTLIQAPILLGCFITFGLPVFSSITSFTTL